MKKNGYTFVEILVVITIIAVMAGLSMVTYIATSKGSRDARRMSDIESIRSALELYRSETGYYPLYSPDADGCMDVTKIVDSSASPEVVYLSVVPKDPQFPDHCYKYDRTTETTYTLQYYSEKDAVTREVTNP